MISAENNRPTPSQLAYYRKEIHAAYREGTLSSEQIEQLQSAGFNFDRTSGSKPVVDLTTGKTFESVSAAQKSIGIGRDSSLRYAIEHKRLLNGHAFWWADDPTPPDKGEFSELANQPRPIIDLTTGKRFETRRLAAEFIGTDAPDAIRVAIQNKRLLKGHAFWWADDPNPPDVSEFHEPRDRAPKPIIDLTTGETFETIAAAVKSNVAASVSVLSAAIKDKRLYKGHAFWWADDPTPPDVSEFRKPIDHRRPVVDLSTDRVFETISDAGKSINHAYPGDIGRAIKDKRLYKGHAFWWADDPNPPDVSEFRIPASQTKPVVDLTTGEVFETIVSASKAIGAGYAGIVRKAIEHKRLLNGHAFWWADDPNPPDIGEFSNPQGSATKSSATNADMTIRLETLRAHTR